MTSPFDFVTAASLTKKDLLEEGHRESDYNSWLTNKAFSYFADSVLHSNEMNRLYELDNKSQFYYYINILRSRKRFKKWFKGELDNNIELICNAYGCSKRVAKQYLNILSNEQITLLKEQQEKGGV